MVATIGCNNKPNPENNSGVLAKVEVIASSIELENQAYPFYFYGDLDAFEFTGHWRDIEEHTKVLESENKDDYLSYRPEELWRKKNTSDVAWQFISNLYQSHKNVLDYQNLANFEMIVYHKSNRAWFLNSLSFTLEGKSPLRPNNSNWIHWEIANLSLS